jgi:hypothetical protein
MDGNTAHFQSTQVTEGDYDIDIDKTKSGIVTGRTTKYSSDIE